MSDALTVNEQKFVLGALSVIPVELLKPHQKAALTRAKRIIVAHGAKAARSSRRGLKQNQKLIPAPGQQPIDLQFRKYPPSIQRRNRARWAKYPFEMVQEARRLRHVKQWTYRDIAETLNHRFGTTVNWITVRDWTVQSYRVMG